MTSGAKSVQPNRGRLRSPLVATASTYVLRALRWVYLLQPIGPTRFSVAFRTTVIGFAANSVLPARVGEVLRPYLLARRENLPVTATFATIILERLLDLVTVLLLFGAFVLFFDPGMASVNPAIYQTVKAGGLLGAIGSVAALIMVAVLARQPEAFGRAVDRSTRVLPEKLAGPLVKMAQTFVQGLAVTRSPAAPRRLRRALAAALAVHRRRHLGLHAGLSYDDSLHGIVPCHGPARGRRGGADARRGGRFPRGLPHRRDGVLRHRERSGGGRGDRAARRVVPAGDAAGRLVHVPRRAGFERRAPRQRRGARSGGAGVVKCPYCGHLGDKVVDSRESREGEVIRRRRECLECGRRFTSYERVDEIPYMVVKKDGRRERFERQKLIAGLLRACEKRPVSVAALELIADRVEMTLQDRPEKEMATADIGAFVMQELKRLDKVAYVRFASVYRHFRDVGEFMTELRDLLGTKEQ